VVSCFCRNRNGTWTAVSRDGYQPVGGRAASATRAAGVVSAHTAEQIISAVTVHVAARPMAVAAALAFVALALRHTAVSPSG
jgi:hypothetical protein